MKTHESFLFAPTVSKPSRSMSDTIDSHSARSKTSGTRKAPATPATGIVERPVRLLARSGLTCMPHSAFQPRVAIGVVPSNGAFFSAAALAAISAAISSAVITIWLLCTLRTRRISERSWGLAPHHLIALRMVCVVQPIFSCCWPRMASFAAPLDCTES